MLGYQIGQDWLEVKEERRPEAVLRPVWSKRCPHNGREIAVASPPLLSGLYAYTQLPPLASRGRQSQQVPSLQLNYN